MLTLKRHTSLPHISRLKITAKEQDTHIPLSRIRATKIILFPMQAIRIFETAIPQTGNKRKTYKQQILYIFQQTTDYYFSIIITSFKRSSGVTFNFCIFPLA